MLVQVTYASAEVAAARVVDVVAGVPPAVAGVPPVVADVGALLADAAAAITEVLSHNHSCLKLFKTYFITCPMFSIVSAVKAARTVERLERHRCQLNAWPALRRNTLSSKNPKREPHRDILCFCVL